MRIYTDEVDENGGNSSKKRLITLNWARTPALPPSPWTNVELDTMTKHSKNNTASSIFSYAEYKKLDYGTKRVRRRRPALATSPRRHGDGLVLMPKLLYSNGLERSPCGALTVALSVCSERASRSRATKATFSARSACTPTSVRPCRFLISPEN